MLCFIRKVLLIELKMEVGPNSESHLNPGDDDENLPPG